MTLTQDAMQVCWNGHVITDLLHSYPERGSYHCDLCGAATLDHCLTCGQTIAGAVVVPGLPTAGSLPPPNYCGYCGAAFPWTARPKPPVVTALKQLEALLRRLPKVVQQLRWRQSNLPPFRVEEDRDLEDLLRALMAIHFDEIRLEKRTPSYCPGTITDFLLPSQAIAVTCKLARPNVCEHQLGGQLVEDSAYHRGRPGCRLLIGLIYDPEATLRDPSVMERAWSSGDGGFELRCIVATP